MRIEDVYDLNEINVKKFIKYIKARPDEDEDKIRQAYAYINEDGRFDSRTLFYFSKERYKEQEDRIVGMLGQLKIIHDLDKEYIRENLMMDFIDLQIKYDETRWTENLNCTLFLFWLGNAGGYFAGLKKYEDGIYRSDLRDGVPIPPMESPNDPNLVKRFPRR